MGYEIQVDVDYFDHPKTVALIALLGPTADVFPLRLWRWCAIYAKNGVVSGGAAQIESAVKWRAKPGKLHAALVETGFIKKDGKTVNSWMEHTGRFIKAYENKKEKQRKKYSLKNGIMPEESGILPPSSAPNRREENNRELNGIELNGREGENAPPEIDDATFLAQEFAFDGGDGTSPAAIARARAVMVDLLKAGFTRQRLYEEIKRPGRTASEHPGEFRRHLEKSNAKPVDTDAGFDAVASAARARSGRG